MLKEWSIEADGLYRVQVRAIGNIGNLKLIVSACVILESRYLLRDITQYDHIVSHREVPQAGTVGSTHPYRREKHSSLDYGVSHKTLAETA